MYNKKNGVKKILTAALAAALAAGCLTSVSLVGYAAEEEETYFVEDDLVVAGEGDFLADENYSGENQDTDDISDDLYISYPSDNDFDDFADESRFTSGDYEFGVKSDGTAVILKYNGSDETVEIPSSIEGHSVVRIAYQAFLNNTTIKKVVFPDTVTEIGSYSFSGCSSLRDVAFSDSIEIIYESAFNKCVSIESLDIPGNIKTICSCAFTYCISLKELTLNEGIEVIANGAFAEDESLTEVVIPSTVISVDAAAFRRAKSLEAITLAEGNENLTVIDGVLFNKDCTRLLCYPAGKQDEVYEIPDTVQVVMLSSFGGASNLKEVMLPEELVSVGWFGLSECNGLKRVLIPANVRRLGSYSLGYILKDNIDIGNETGTGEDLRAAGDFVIYGTKGSAAESYASSNGITFRDASAYVRYLQNKTTVSKTNFTVGETVSVKGNASGGDGKYTYEFYYKRSTASGWTRFGKDGKGSFKPGSAGSFTIRTYVKDSRGVTTKKDFELTAVNPLANKTAVSKTNFTVGETVSVTGAAEGGDGQYTYEFYYKRSTASSWTRFGRNGKGNFKPGSAGTFTIRTYVKDGAGRTVKKNFELTAVAKLSNNTTVSKERFNVGETVSINGAAAGGDGQYTYEFYYKRSTASSWTRFGKDGKGNFKPGSAGSFTIRTYVKDGSGTSVKKDFTLTAI